MVNSPAGRQGFRGFPAAVALAWRAGRFTWLGTVGLAIVTGVVSPASAWVLKELIGLLTHPSPAVGMVVALAVASVLLGGLNHSLETIVMLVATACQRTISVAVTSKLYAAVNRIQGLRHFERPGFQDDLRLAERAVDDMPMALSSLLSMAIQGGATVAGYTAILIATWPPMALLLAAACVPAVLAQPFLSRNQAKASEQTASQYREWFLMRGLLSDPRAVMESRLLGTGEFFQSRMIDALRAATTGDYLAKRRTAWAESGLSVLGGAVTAIGAAVVAVKAAHGTLSPGDFVMFLAAVTGTQSVLLGAIYQSVSVGATIRLLSHYSDVLSIGTDLGPPAPHAARPVPALRSGIALRDVWFRYDDDSRWVLRGADAWLPHGQATALVGTNGAGKTTLIKLLCRLYDPQRGAILWDGIDLRDLDPAELRQRLAITFQDFLTYDLTAWENIGIGDLRARQDRQRIIVAARMADLDDAVRSLPHGYDTVLSRKFSGEAGEQGTLLSGGQNQRLALARTLMRENADLMVLDEPSSGLDAESEHRIHQALQRHRQGRTSLLVSHRLSAVRDADQILVLADGRITERGTHDDLMAGAGRYARLFALQASAYQDERVRAPVPRKP